jgi:hypothetical protein
MAVGSLTQPSSTPGAAALRSNPTMLDAPDWQLIRECHDWRNYVLPEYREHWQRYSLETRIAIYSHACLQADNEDWD